MRLTAHIEHAILTVQYYLNGLIYLFFAYSYVNEHVFLPLKIKSPFRGVTNSTDSGADYCSVPLASNFVVINT